MSKLCYADSLCKIQHDLCPVLFIAQISKIRMDRVVILR